jgi:hypothetical protein
MGARQEGRLMDVSIALVHHPVLDREGKTITTAITNLDLHDLARSACTYGIREVFMVHPVAAQRELAERVKHHWVQGTGARRIPSREPALGLLSIVESLEEMYERAGGRSAVEAWVTSARAGSRTAIPLAEARARLADREGHVIVLFGTGWGLTPAVLESADALLAPIGGNNASGYNHLSVRAACAITLDRLLGQ